MVTAEPPIQLNPWMEPGSAMASNREPQDYIANWSLSMPNVKGKVTGKDLLKLAASKIGQEYVYGAAVPFSQGDYNGPWDCAEFVSWVIWKLTGKKYGFTEDGHGEPWTGAWLEDILHRKVYRVPLSVAVKTPGAVLLRRTKKHGHIAFSCGNGATIEAKGTQYGVCSDTSDPDVRGWSYGILIPEVEYA